jgi:lactoylglutathione lyase
MSTAPQPTTPNVKQVVPFFRIADMERSMRFYIDGLGFTMKYRWIPDDKIRWCWLELGGAALMLQEYQIEGPHSLANKGTLGLGVSLCFQCQDALALYHDYVAKGLAPSEPFVGNHMWVTHLDDPDGYRVEFESPTDVPEETKLSDLKS